VFCPQCRTEYREGFDRCADCQVPLVNELPPEPVSDVPDPDNLVTILETDDPVLIGAVKSWLENADIPFFVRGEEGQGIMPGIGSARGLNTVQVQVDKDEEENARDLLSDLIEAQSPDDTVDEPEEKPEIPPPQKAEVKREESGESNEIPSSPLSPRAKALFRTLVLIELVLAFLCIKLGTLASESAPVDIKTYLSSLLHSETILQIGQGEVHRLLLFLRFSAALGLMVFWGPARHLYLALWLWTIISATFAGGTIVYGIATLCLYLDLLVAGAIMASIYFSPMKPAFRKAAT
jgi:hypothetical protein